MPVGAAKQAPNDITTTTEFLNSQDPTAFRDITVNWLRNKAAKAATEGTGKAAAPKQFADTLLTNPNLDTIIEHAARGGGAADPVAVAQGFRRSLEFLQATGRQLPQAGGGELASIGSTSFLSKLATLGLGSGLARKGLIVGTARGAIGKAQMQILSDALASPDSMAKLADIAKGAQSSGRVRGLIAELYGGGMGATEDQLQSRARDQETQ